ncbi:MAG: hypothetical protein E6Q97_34810 [Desulfurellales bacterium]|nr:MAG: hypothetical protein E6Q97_34810 [Desulfurellales bacterium]
MFKIGQKVICIDASVYSDAQPYLPFRCKLNQVYTVRSIHTEKHLTGYGIRLEEVINPSFLWSDSDEKEWSFDHRKFRPAVEHNNQIKVEATA